jgi:DNA (cytosine-5)-methyltransferase 1
MPNLRDYLTVGRAAEFLGVSAWTLRYWDRTGKLKPSRHPLSRYRLYRRDDLEALLQVIAGGAAAPRRRAGPFAGTRAKRGHPTRVKTAREVP